jgi:eukaryotic-like serine/threonine-protein kinase
MALAPGTRFGTYEIASQIGAGGMGEVYRARDTRLNRDVAIKVLPDAFTHDPDRLARFTREAHLLAALNHPHIGAIYGIEDDAGRRALILELVKGDTLADRIAQGRIPLRDALPIARQICEALQTAHEQGIIHRDLKPSNIKLTPDDIVKVLDFGLAKLGHPDAVSGRDVTLSPTITSPALMTTAGVVLGTAAYMSPEQAKGREADKRSDVWAFGCVLYEMLSGRRAFDGEDMTDVLGAVVRLEPEWQALPADMPAAIRTLLQQCLVKDRRKRVADLAAARFVLDDQLLAATSIVPPAAAPRRSRWLRVAALSIAALAIAAVAAMLARYTQRPAPAHVVRSILATSGSTELALSGLWRDLAITPDGLRVVYLGNSQLLVRALDQLESRVLTRGAPRNPFISPDGQWVGFFEGSTMKRVAITGGPPETLTQVQGDAGGATWGPDGTIVFATGDAASGLMRVPAEGGAPAVLTKLNREERDHVWPEFLPGGRALLFTIYPAVGGLDNTRVAVLDLQTGSSKVLIRGGSHAHYLPTGHLVYGIGGTLRAVGFDLSRLELTGTSAPVVDGVAMTRTGGVEAAVAPNGTLVYIPGTGGARRTIVSVDGSGRASPLPGLQPDIYRQLRVSPDGRRLAYSALGDIWVYEFARAQATKLTTDPASDTNPVWTPDGQRIVFTTFRAGYPEIFWRAADGTGSDERLFTRAKDLTSLFASSWSADGTQLIFSEVPGNLQSFVGQFTLGRSGDVRVLLKNNSSNGRAAISPDGRWIAYESNTSGQSEIYVERYPELGNRVQISSGGGRDARWSSTGDELFFGTEDGRQLFAASVRPGATLDAKSPRVLFDVAMAPIVAGDQSYDVASDGRFVVIRNEADADGRLAPTLVLIQNWSEELKRLLPTN